MYTIKQRVKLWFVYLLWRVPAIARRYCWADAVMWAVYGDDEMLTHARYDCYYCGACHTAEEMRRYQNEAARTCAEEMLKEG